MDISPMAKIKPQMLRLYVTCAVTTGLPTVLNGYVVPKYKAANILKSVPKQFEYGQMWAVQLSLG